MTVELTIAPEDRRPSVDLVAAELAAAQFLAALGVELDGEGLGDTPARALLGTLRADPRSRAEFFAPAGVSG